MYTQGIIYNKNIKGGPVVASDVPGPAWAQSPGLGWASAGSGLQILKPDPEPTVRPGSGLVGLEPRLESPNGNMEMAHKINCFSNFLV